MSANPHNPSLGLPDDESPGNRLPDVRRSVTAAIAEDAGRFICRFPIASHPSATRPDTKLCKLCWRSPACTSRYASGALAKRSGEPLDDDVWQLEHFVLDEVLQLVAERALTLTGADGVAIAMAEGDAIVCRAAAGSIVPEPGARLDPKSGFSGACLRTGGIVRCDDSENDPRVNVQVCRRLGTRSIVAVPDCVRARHHWFAGSFFRRAARLQRQRRSQFEPAR